MKTFLASICVLAFSLACHGQTERWQISIPINRTGVTNSGVFPDGVGGGAILLDVNVQPAFTRVAWFNAAGTVLLTNDYRHEAKGSDEYAEVLRVTPKILDLKVTNRALLGVESISLQRFTAKDLIPTETPLALGNKDTSVERLASVATPHPDKRGFFTVQLNTTNVLVRRYAY